MGSPPQRTVGKWGEVGGEGRKNGGREGGDGWGADRVGGGEGCRLCTGVGVVLCGGGAVAPLNGETDVISPLRLLLLLLQLLFLLLLQLLLLLEGTGIHGVFRGHGSVASLSGAPAGRGPKMDLLGTRTSTAETEWQRGTRHLEKLRYEGGTLGSHLDDDKIPLIGHWVEVGGTSLKVAPGDLEIL